MAKYFFKNMTQIRSSLCLLMLEWKNKSHNIELSYIKLVILGFILVSISAYQISFQSVTVRSNSQWIDTEWPDEI